MFSRRRIQRIVAARRARTALGVVGVACAVGVAVAAIANHPVAITFLLAAWPLMAVVYAVVRLGSPRPFPISEASIGVVGDGRGALFWPTAAVSLLAPLTLHYLVAAIGEFGLLPNGYLQWIRFAGGFTLPAHLALVGFCYAFARSRAGHDLKPMSHVLGFSLVAVLITTGVGCVPGILLVLPPIIVGVTALVFVPPMFGVMAAIDRREREALPDPLRTPTSDSLERAHAIVRHSGYATATRLRSLRDLAEHEVRARFKATLDEIVARPDDPLVPQALEVALEQFHRPPLEALLAQVGLAPRAVARLLGHYRDDARALEALVPLLGHESVAVRIAAIESLGRIGGVAEIGLLRATLRGADDRDVQQAIARIRRRTATGDSGALSVVESDGRGGELSVTGEGGGEVSLPR